MTIFSCSINGQALRNMSKNELDKSVITVAQKKKKMAKEISMDVQNESIHNYATGMIIFYLPVAY